MLAGLLSVMGFSINDTIVVFDRVRENFRSLRVEPLEVLNRSINQTLSRTIITAVMFFLSALALYMYGGASLEGLAETQMIGAVIVVLSSIFVAVPDADHRRPARDQAGPDAEGQGHRGARAPSVSHRLHAAPEKPRPARLFFCAGEAAPGAASLLCAREMRPAVQDTP